MRCRNLPEKTLGGKQWATEHLNDQDFYLSTDDDVILDIGGIVDLIKNWMSGKENLIEFPIFCINGAAFHGRPFRDIRNKYYVSRETYPSSIYPPFCLGPGLVTSIRIARKLLEESRKYEIAEIHLEDVWITGILRTRAKMPNSIIQKSPRQLALHQFAYAKVPDKVLFAKQKSEWLWGSLKNRATCTCNSYMSVQNDPTS